MTQKANPSRRAGCILFFFIFYAFYTLFYEEAPFFNGNLSEGGSPKLCWRSAGVSFYGPCSIWRAGHRDQVILVWRGLKQSTTTNRPGSSSITCIIIKCLQRFQVSSMPRLFALTNNYFPRFLCKTPGFPFKLYSQIFLRSPSQECCALYDTSSPYIKTSRTAMGKVWTFCRGGLEANLLQPYCGLLFEEIC